VQIKDDELVIRLQTTRQARAVSIRGVPMQTSRTTMQPSLKQPSRRQVAVALAALAVLPLAPVALAKSGPLVEVWKSPTCGCCKDWIAHLEANGFRTRTHDDGNTDARARLGVDIRYGSCHTALVEGYAIEGHVPAREIKRLLKEKPTAIGLAVPAMPLGSPGMDGPAYGGRKDAYDVLLLTKGADASVFQAYR